MCGRMSSCLANETGKFELSSAMRQSAALHRIKRIEFDARNFPLYGLGER